MTRAQAWAEGMREAQERLGQARQLVDAVEATRPRFRVTRPMNGHLEEIAVAEIDDDGRLRLGPAHPLTAVETRALVEWIARLTVETVEGGSAQSTQRVVLPTSAKDARAGL